MPKPKPNTTIERKRVAILYAGGRTAPFAGQADFDEWCAEFFEMQMVCRITPVLVSGKMVTNDVTNVERLIRALLREWKRYDGFVVTFPPQNFLYSVNLLHLMFGSAGKPVVCTTVQASGAERTYSEMALKANILNAMNAAAADISGVGVMLGSTLIQAPDVLLDTQERGERYFPQPGATVAQLDFGILVNAGVPARSDLLPTPDTQASADVYYLNVRVDPQIQDEFVWPPTREAQAARALIIDGGDYLKLSITKELPDLPVLLLSEEAAYYYRSGQLTEIAGLTPGAASAQLAWLLGHGAEPDSLLARLQAANPNAS